MGAISTYAARIYTHTICNRLGTASSVRKGDVPRPTSAECVVQRDLIRSLSRYCDLQCSKSATVTSDSKNRAVKYLWCALVTTNTYLLRLVGIANVGNILPG